MNDADVEVIPKLAEATVVFPTFATEIVPSDWL